MVAILVSAATTYLAGPHYQNCLRLDEIMQDERGIMSWIPAKLQRAIVDVKTDGVLNGIGTSPNMQSLLDSHGDVPRQGRFSTWIGD